MYKKCFSNYVNLFYGSDKLNSELSDLTSNCKTATGTKSWPLKLPVIMNSAILIFLHWLNWDFSDVKYYLMWVKFSHLAPFDSSVLQPVLTMVFVYLYIHWKCGPSKMLFGNEFLSVSLLCEQWHMVLPSSVLYPWPPIDAVDELSHPCCTVEFYV